MTRYTLMAYSNAKPGRREAYTRWLDKTHIPDVLKIPGVRSAQRYSLRVHKGAVPWSELTIYELSTEDLDGLLREIQVRRGTAVLPISDDLDHDSIALVWGERAGVPVFAG